MKIYIKNALLITMDAGKIYRNGCVITNGSKIFYAGEEKEMPADCDKVIDARGGIVMPGLINAHTHTPMTLLRGCADDLPLDVWLTEHIFPLEDRLDDEGVYYGSLLACAEMIKSGTTTFADMYFMSENTAKAVLLSGMNANLARCVTGQRQDYKKRLDESRALYKTYHGAGGGKIRVDHSVHAVYTCSPEAIRAVSEAAAQDGTLLQLHLSETMKENRECYGKYGKSPTEVMHDLGVFSVPVNAAHCVYLSENDMDILKSCDAAISHNPTSNLKLASGVANIKEIMDKGIPVALGTDGTASNNSLDMFSEIKLAALLHKGMRLDATLICAQEALEMATVNGAKALGREGKCGVLKEGYRADLIILDADAPSLMPVHDPVSAVVYGGCGGQVVTSIIGGDVVMENRELLTLDIEMIKDGIKRATERMGL